MSAASRALTVKLKALPEVKPPEPGTATEKCVGAAVPTVIALEVPVREAVAESVAVIVWLPNVVKVAGKLAEPFVNVESAGRDTRASVLVKRTVPV